MTEHACGTMVTYNQCAPGTAVTARGREPLGGPLMQERSRPDVARWRIPWASDPQPYLPSGAALRLGLPASWEDMEALGLDPLTGERVAA